MDSVVSLVKSKNEGEGVVSALNYLSDDLKNALEGKSRLVVKVNFVCAGIELACTPFNAVKEFVENIRGFYSGEILIVEEPTMGTASNAYNQYGYEEWADNQEGVELVDLAEDEAVTKKIDYKGGSVTLDFSKTMLDSDFLVSICRPKTHDTVVATMAIKNVLVGAIMGGGSGRRNIHKGKDINWILSSCAEVVYPDLAIIDGAIGMQGNGPCGGEPINSGWTIASLDPLAADSLGAYLMGFEINDIGYMNLIKEELDLGNLFEVDDIDIVGEIPQSLVKPFIPHDTYPSQKLWEK